MNALLAIAPRDATYDEVVDVRRQDGYDIHVMPILDADHPDRVPPALRERICAAAHRRDADIILLPAG